MKDRIADFDFSRYTVYQPVLKWSLQLRWLTILLAIATLIATWPLIGHLQTAFPGARGDQFEKTYLLWHTAHAPEAENSICSCFGRGWPS